MRLQSGHEAVHLPSTAKVMMGRNHVGKHGQRWFKKRKKKGKTTGEGRSGEREGRWCSLAHNSKKSDLPILTARAIHISGVREKMLLGRFVVPYTMNISIKDKYMCIYANIYMYVCICECIYVCMRHMHVIKQIINACI